MDLIFYSSVHEEKVNSMKVTDAQLLEVGLPQRAIQMSCKNKTRSPVIFMVKDQVMVFFVLQVGKEVSEFSDNPNAILLRNVVTDSRHEGKGYATKAIKLLPDFVKNNYVYINEIVLSVSESNQIAIRLYEAAGFKTNGKQLEGPRVRQLIMSLKVRD